MYKLSLFRNSSRNSSASLVLFWIVGKRGTTASFSIWATLLHNLVQWRSTTHNSLTYSLMSSETESPVGNIMTVLLRYLATMEFDYLGNLWYYLICRLVEVKTSSDFPSVSSVRGDPAYGVSRDHNLFLYLGTWLIIPSRFHLTLNL